VKERRCEDEGSRIEEPVRKRKSDSAARQGKWYVKQSGQDVKHQNIKHQTVSSSDHQINNTQLKLL